MNETKKQKTPENIGFMKKAARFVAAPLIAGLLTIGCNPVLKNVNTKIPRKASAFFIVHMEYEPGMRIRPASQSELNAIDSKAPASQQVTTVNSKPMLSVKSIESKLDILKRINNPISLPEYRFDDNVIYKIMPPVNLKLRKPSDLKKITKPFIPRE